MAVGRSCWSLNDWLGLPFDGAFVDESPLSWIARNSSKPERADDRESWVLHASPEWTAGSYRGGAADGLRQLTDAFWQAVDLRPRNANSRRPSMAILNPVGTYYLVVACSIPPNGSERAATGVVAPVLRAHF